MLSEPGDSLKSASKGLERYASLLKLFLKASIVRVSGVCCISLAR